MAHLPTWPTLLIAFILLSSSPQISGSSSPPSTSPPSTSLQTSGSPSECEVGPTTGCHDKSAALHLKIITICAILVTGMIGVSLPLLTRSIPAFHPDRSLFSIVKAFASGVILATGYMHVMPDSFDDLTSECLPEIPWRKFPFTTLVAMLSALVTLMVNSFAMRKHNSGRSVSTDSSRDLEMGAHVHAHDHMHRVVAQVLELGIVVHSVVIGLSLGASQNPCTIRPLAVAVCFHQLFEGIGLGSCILQADYQIKMKAIMAFFFSFTTPFGIALGIGLSNIYRDDSPTALIIVGLLNASSAGLLNYMALVDLLAADFMGPKLQSNLRLQIWAYVAVFLGAGSMSLLAIWT